MQLYKELEKELKKEANFVSDNGELKKWVILSKALNGDETLISILLSNSILKQNFFDEVKNVLVFKQSRFVQFLEQKNYLNDSYTLFKNKVGLFLSDKYIKQNTDIVLVWPYKDCILEGGQTKEEQARDEIFFNCVLAQDEITHLLAPKVFTNVLQYTSNGGSKKMTFSRDQDDSISENLIIKGNNLLALHSILPQFSGKVKLIYIDPPFNTGKDSFSYNDSFNHSTWLTFMKNRLEAGKKLLATNGFICVHVGNEEAAYVQVLMDEIFGRENYLNHITMSTNAPSGFKATSAKIFSTANHIFFYAKDSTQTSLNKLYVEKEYDSNYKNFLLNPEEKYSKWEYCTIQEYLAKEEGFADFSAMKKKQGEALLVEKIKAFANQNKERVFRTAAVGGGALKKRKPTIERSKKNKGQVMQHPEEDVENFFILNGEQIVFWGDGFREVNGKVVPASALTDIWTDIGFTGIANEGGVTLKNGKKPESLLKRIIELTTKKGDLVLDYHAGSGTTCAVAHKLKRRYIGIEQLDYGDNDCVVRLNNVIKGDTSGISNDTDVNWRGGGDFVYVELKKYNEQFFDQIREAKTSKQIHEIWKQIKNHSFVDYNVTLKTLEESENEFLSLDITQQKEFLLDILDKNYLYVNLSQINDKDFKCSDEEIAITKSFFKIK